MMDRTKQDERIVAIAERIIESEGMELVEMQFRRERNGWVLRFYIDREGGVTLDHCADISRQISCSLDVEDIIQHKYTLEVSSPGINRPLTRDKDFIRNCGKKVRVKTSIPLEGRKNFAGVLSEFKDGKAFLVTSGGKEYAIKREDIAAARLDSDIKI